MVNRVLIVKLIYLSILLIGCHGSVADEEERTELPQSSHGAPASEGALEEEYVKSDSGKYQLVKGQQYPLCRDFLENLESLNHPVMTCQRQLNPKLTKFRAIKWQPVDPIDYEQILKEVFWEQMHQVGKYRDDPELLWTDWKARWEDIPNRLKKGEYFLGKATFNIDHMGGDETVLYLVENGCGTFRKQWIELTNPADPHLVVLDESGKHHDRAFYILTRSDIDAFYYDGRVRLARWRGKSQAGWNIKSPLENLEFHLRILEGGRSRGEGSTYSFGIVCDYVYTNNEEDQ